MDPNIRALVLSTLTKRTPSLHKQSIIFHTCDPILLSEVLAGHENSAVDIAQLKHCEATSPAAEETHIERQAAVRIGSRVQHSSVEQRSTEGPQLLSSITLCQTNMEPAKGS